MRWVLDLGLADAALLAAVVLAGGAVTGFLAGLFGIGGGAVSVPVLYEVLGAAGVGEQVRMQLCVGTALAIIVPTSISSFATHRAAGKLPVAALRTWTPPIVVGVCCGGLIAAVAPAWVFKLAFVVVSLLLAARMFFVSGAWRLGDTLPGYPAMLAHGLVIGLYASLMGVGGGAYATLILMLYGATIHAAIGVSAGIGVAISTVGTVVYGIAGLGHQQWLPPLAVGYVWLPGVALMAPASALAARYGARVAHAMPKRRLEVAFGWYMIAVALRFAYDFL